MPPTIAGDTQTLAEVTAEFRQQEAAIALGGGRSKAIARQHEKGRLTARERIERLIDPGSRFFEIGLWGRVGDVYRVGRCTGRRRCLRRRHHRRAPAHDHRQRRHG